MALAGIRVIELAGLAPVPFCGMILSDFGAKVIRVDKVKSPYTLDRLARGKLSIALDVKSQEGQDILQKLCTTADVLLEPFRPGVMESHCLGPDKLMPLNPQLIYARLTGYGQIGPCAGKAGHDINYLATSGVLSMLGRHNQRPHAPINLLADFAGGGLMCAFGVVAALVERGKSGRGQVIDASMTEGAAYIGAWLRKSQSLPYVWQSKERGLNLLDGGSHFYDTYETADGKFMSVGALEPKFYSDLLKGLGLKDGEVLQVDDPSESRERFAKIFITKTQKEWTEIFDKLDACVMPVQSLEEAPNHPQNKAMGTFRSCDNGVIEVIPAPKLSRTPGASGGRDPHVGEHTREILLDLGYSPREIEDLLKIAAVEENIPDSKL